MSHHEQPHKERESLCDYKLHSYSLTISKVLLYMQVIVLGNSIVPHIGATQFPLIKIKLERMDEITFKL